VRLHSIGAWRLLESESDSGPCRDDGRMALKLLTSKPSESTTHKKPRRSGAKQQTSKAKATSEFSVSDHANLAGADLRFRLSAHKPSRPVAKSGSAPGSGVARVIVESAEPALVATIVYR
jgi:hypothetical protein